MPSRSLNQAKLQLALVALLVSALAFALSSSSKAQAARTWKGVSPGITTRTEVIHKLGVPTQDLTKGGGETGVLYQGKTAPEGTKQVQIFFDANNVVTQIHVFPKAEINREQVINTYGKDFIERLNDSFKTYFYYKGQGLVVYFKEGTQVVASITFQKPSKPTKGEEGTPKGEKPGLSPNTPSSGMPEEAQAGETPASASPQEPAKP